MTLVYSRPVPAGAAVHAFILGVGAYPAAKPAGPRATRPPELYNVKDLPSAAVGAGLFADWLIAHADLLPAPLSSVELLVSDPARPAGMGGTYDWASRPEFAGALAGGGTDPRPGSTDVAAANLANVSAAGLDWANRLTAGPAAHVAIFFICGHGVAIPTRSLVFLEDLAGLPAPATSWEPFLDVQLLASTLQRVSAIQTAYLFVDACQETVAQVILSQADPTTAAGPGVRFFTPEGLSATASKVLLLVPGPMGTLAFDDGQDGGGRYTHVLIEALSGAAARETSGTGTWGVFADVLPRAMKQLYALRWADGALVPTPAASPVSDAPLVQFNGARPQVPVRIRFDPPAAINQAQKVWLQDPGGAEIVARADNADVWLERVPARQGLCTVNADFGAVQDYASTPQPIDLSEMRIEPIIVHRVSR